MSYKNASQILPPEVVELIQRYVDGEYVYIPRKVDCRRAWGSQTGCCEQTAERNRSIYRDYLDGATTAELAEKYYLSVKRVQRIVLEQRAQ